jgi:hypothetical protein
MQPHKPATAAVTVLAYIATTFAVQGGSHFGVNADYYAAIPIMRAQPIVAMGLASMVIQGLIFAWLYPAFAAGASTVRKAVLFSWTLGAFLASYIALGEAGQYAIPSISRWIAVEGSVALVQYTLFGVWLGLIHRAPAAVSLRQAA